MARTRSRTTTRYERRSRDAVTAAAGFAVLVVGMVIVREHNVSGVEEAVFRAINDLPQALYYPLWPFQQAGNIVVGPVVAIVAFALRRYRLGWAALAATFLKLLSERGVKKIVTRPRPGTSIGLDIHMRGDVHANGPSFVSGHAVLIAALATIVTPYLPGRWKFAPWIVVGLVLVARTYVGAHNPLDVVCGAGLGLAIGGLLNLAFGVPAPASVEPEPPA